jgi:zinc-binding in reverse transcriptase
VGLYHSEWCDLKFEFRTFILNQYNEDIILWRWHSKASFSMHSLYRWLEYGGFKNTDFAVIWKTNIPLKIKIFVWLVRKNRVLTKINLSKKDWNENTQCMFCKEDESTDHLFVTCPFYF